MKTSRFAINWFVDFDKEERWINEMSKAGWAFWHTNGVFYRFKKCELMNLFTRLTLMRRRQRTKWMIMCHFVVLAVTGLYINGNRSCIGKG